MAELLVSSAFLAGAEASAPVVLGEPLAYGELRERVLGLAAAMRSELAPGAFVLLALEPAAASIVAYLAVLRAGLTAVPLGASHAGEALDRILAETRPAARLGDFGALGRRLDGVPDWSRAGERVEAAGAPPQPEGDARALVLYTSGTTAAPKGVVLSQRNLAANTASILAAVPLHAADVVAQVLPLHYSYGLSVLHTTLATGALLAPVPGFGMPSDCVRRLAAAGATVFPGVPFHFEALLSRETGFEQAGVPGLRCAMVAGGPMPQRLATAFRQRFPGAELNVMYGQTEGSARLSALPPSELAAKPDSIGRGLPGVELAVLDARGAPVAPGEIGEIYARGENLMCGYLGDAEASAEVLTPRGLRTRDLAEVDADGYVYVVGRRSDFAKIRGHRVGLAEVEAAIESCDGVAEAVVLCGEEDGGEERLCAEVVFASGSAPEDAVRELRAELRKLLPAVQRPAQIRAVDSVPRTASGKKVRWREQ